MARKQALAVGAGLVLSTLAIYLLRLNDAAGLMVDDAWYVLLAKSLADGSGYRMISSAAAPILPLYPPGFPAILSVVFQISPDFPQNVPLLKGASIAAMVGVGLLTYVYAHGQRRLGRELAVCIAVGVAIVPAFVFEATSTVMSECMFTLVQLAAVVLIHRSVESPDSRQSVWFGIAAAGVAAGAVLIRTAALGLIIAMALWLLKERRWKTAALFAAVVVFCLLPWTTYARLNAPTALQRSEHGGAVVYDYFDQLSMRWAGSPGSGRITLGDIPARIATNLTDVFARDMIGVFVPVFLRSPAESGEEVVSLGGTAGLLNGGMGGAPVTMALSLLLSTVVLTGFVVTARKATTVAEFLVPVSVAVILLWPFWSFRFMLPLVPFLFFYLVVGLRALTQSARATRMTLLCIIGLSLYDHAGYIAHNRSQAEPVRGEWVANARDVEAALVWIRDHLGSDGTIASSNPALVYLKTGRKSIGYDDSSVKLAAWRARGVRYLVCLVPLELPGGAPGEYQVLYHSPARLWVIGL